LMNSLSDGHTFAEIIEEKLKAKMDDKSKVFLGKLLSKAVDSKFNEDCKLWEFKELIQAMGMDLMDYKEEITEMGLTMHEIKEIIYGNGIEKLQLQKVRNYYKDMLMSIINYKEDCSILDVKEMIEKNGKNLKDVMQSFGIPQTIISFIINDDNDAVMLSEISTKIDTNGLEMLSEMKNVMYSIVESIPVDAMTMESLINKLYNGFGMTGDALMKMLKEMQYFDDDFIQKLLKKSEEFEERDTLLKCLVDKEMAAAEQSFQDILSEYSMGLKLRDVFADSFKNLFSGTHSIVHTYDTISQGMGLTDDKDKEKIDMMKQLFFGTQDEEEIGFNMLQIALKQWTDCSIEELRTLTKAEMEMKLCDVGVSKEYIINTTLDSVQPMQSKKITAMSLLKHLNEMYGTCGNGMLERNEECDCGPFQCDCCDAQTCKSIKSKKSCVGVGNGERCNLFKGYCYNYECVTKDKDNEDDDLINDIIKVRVAGTKA